MAPIVAVLFKDIVVAIAKPLFGTGFVVTAKDKLGGWLNFGFQTRYEAFLESFSRSSTLSELGVQSSPLVVRHIYSPRLFVTPRTPRLLDWNPLVPTSTALALLARPPDLAKELDVGNQVVWQILRHRAAVGSELDGQGYVILGSPGSGKRTLLQHIAYTLATNGADSQGLERGFRPIVLMIHQHINAITKEDPPNLVEVLDAHFQRLGLNPRPGWFDSTLQGGRAVVLVSGFDRVGSQFDDEEGQERRRAVRNWIDNQIINYFRCTFFVTATPLTYATLPLRRTHVLEIQPYSQTQRESFITNFFKTSETVGNHEPPDRSGENADVIGLMRAMPNNERDLARAYRKAAHMKTIIANSPALSELSAWPLLLSLMCVAHQGAVSTPTSRYVIDDVFSMFFEEWMRKVTYNMPSALFDEDVSNSVSRASSARARVGSSATVRSILAPLAAYMTERKMTTITARRAEDVISDHISGLGGKKPEVGCIIQFLLLLQQNSGVVVEKERGLWAFTHRSFQDYLTATHWWERHSAHAEADSFSVDPTETTETNTDATLSPATSAHTANPLTSTLSNKFTQRELDMLVRDPWFFEPLKMFYFRSDSVPVLKTALNDGSNNAKRLIVACVDHESVPQDLRHDAYRHVFDSGNTAQHKALSEKILSRHLQSMAAMRGYRSISNRYVTNAEYALFVQETWNNEGINRQPDHWMGFHSPSGAMSLDSKSALEPVTGLRPSDADAFCTWLTDRDFANTDIRYRLPTPQEAKFYQPSRSSRVGISDTIGTICRSPNNNTYTIAAVPRATEQALSSSLMNLVSKSTLPAPSHSAVELIVRGGMLADALTPMTMSQSLYDGSFTYKRIDACAVNSLEGLSPTLLHIMSYVNNRIRDTSGMHVFAKQEAAALATELSLPSIAKLVTTNQLTAATEAVRALTPDDVSNPAGVQPLSQLMKAARAPSINEGHSVIMSALGGLLPSAHKEVKEHLKRAAEAAAAAVEPEEHASFLARIFSGTPRTPDKSDDVAVQNLYTPLKDLDVDLRTYDYWARLLRLRQSNKIPAVDGLRVVHEFISSTNEE